LVDQDDDILISPTSYANVSDPVDYVPIYAYDDEYEKNEAKRSIQLIDNNYSGQLQKDLANLLSN
jgi:hypothetical protein